jgi:CRP-like cAMP-binding protein
LESWTARPEWINVGSREAPERIADLLGEVFLKLQAVGLTQGNSFDFPITQGEIADATGIATVHVNRNIQKLRAENLIELDNRRCTIANWDKLKQKVASLPVLFEQWSRSQGSLLPHDDH